ncbi:MAG: helix-turn-helix transcriptional regulator [Thermoplasmata archaeon]
MSNWAKIAAAVIACIALVILAYAILTPEQSTDGTNHMGMWHATYSSMGVGLIAASLVILVAALMVLVLWQGYEPLPPDIEVPAPAREHLTPPAETASMASRPGPQPRTGRAAEERAAEDAAHNYLVLRLLTGDERAMFKAIMDSGGRALQKDLISQTKMSNAKVSRVLDRLAEKGVITKERHGSTNMIRIRLQP